MSSASLPIHQYIFVDRSVIRKNGTGFEPAVWFGVHAHPGRVWGCHVMLECGAIYRNVAPHQIAFSEKPDKWTVEQSQLWDCYGRDFTLLRYHYLSTLQGIARVQKQDIAVSYLVTAVPHGEGFSETPEQDKEFMFLKTAGGRLTVQPTNRVLFEEKSFTTKVEWPTDLKRQTESWSCETAKLVGVQKPV